MTSLTSILESQVDIRKLEHIRNKLF